MNHREKHYCYLFAILFAISFQLKYQNEPQAEEVHRSTVKWPSEKKRLYEKMF